MPEWTVDWEVEVPVELTKDTITVSRSEVIEAPTAEAAEEVARDTIWVDESDIGNQIELTDFQLGRPDMDTFKLVSPVNQWGDQ